MSIFLEIMSVKQITLYIINIKLFIIYLGYYLKIFHSYWC